MPVQRRSDFKQALSTLQQLKEKEEEEVLQTPTDSHRKSTNGYKAFLRGGTGKDHGGLLIPYESHDEVETKY